MPSSHTISISTRQAAVRETETSFRRFASAHACMRANTSQPAVFTQAESSHPEKLQDGLRQAPIDACDDHDACEVYMQRVILSLFI